MNNPENYDPKYKAAEGQYILYKAIPVKSPSGTAEGGEGAEGMKDEGYMTMRMPSVPNQNDMAGPMGVSKAWKPKGR